MKGSYNIPNSIPKPERVFNIIWGLGLLSYALYGYQHGELYLPGRGSSDGVTFTGITLNLIIAAMVLGALSLFVTVVDHN
ncbi:hypothetical protein [Pseudoalteromonas sp. NZS71]|uniref:hypothetical protein n=1 Tax=unclassified Pseudoalteromonas TaxID=194690 RepID=UPI0018CEA280|nr:hypothetical protein [Pseudoalteromonas sp. NZS71]MBH0063548.1 hypothetical protein [Pseudoalteromonas sp. NZS71]